MSAEWRFVGRDDELRELEDLVVHQRRSVVLAGPAGVGKTRLAAEVLMRCESVGLAVARAAATAASSEFPFGPLAPLLPTFDPQVAERAEGKAETLRRFATTLVERAAPRRLALFVDDAHLLDSASAALVHQLALTGNASVILTVRTGEPVPDPVTALWKDNLAERREISSLSRTAMGDMMAAALGGPIDQSAVAALADRCGGNALFLRELMIGARDNCSLRNDGGIWRLVSAPTPSARLLELVSGRLAGLDPDELALLEIVVVGEPLGLGELAAIGDADLAERLERSGWLTSRTDGQRLTVSFAHPLYGEGIRAQLPGLRRRALARALADTTENFGARRREDLLRVATWRLDGGGGSPDHMLAAARIARWHYDFGLAERLVQAAGKNGAGFPARLLAAQLAGLQGRVEEAESQLAELARTATGDEERATVALSRIDNLAFYLGRPEEGMRVAEEVEAAITDTSWRDQIQARRSALVFAVDGPRAGAELSVPVLERAEGRALVWAAQVATFTLGRLGRIDEALAASTRAHDEWRTVDEPMDWYPWTHDFFRSQVLSWSGRLAEADEIATARYEQALLDHSTEAQAWFAWHRASVIGERGTVDSCVLHGREAVALFRDLGRPQFMAFCLPYLALALALGGRTPEAAATLAQLDRLGTRDHFMGVDPLQARAWFSVAEGDLPEARKHLRRAADIGAEIGDFVGRAAALHGLARLGLAREVHDELSQEPERVEGELVVARAAHARALGYADADGLVAVADDFEHMSAHLLAAEAAVDALAVLRKTGDRRQNAVAERRARALIERCSGTSTPALNNIERDVMLSPAEHDAALLAAAGRSNKEIADELHLSVRSVEGRLQRAYARLGVSSRAELAEVLRKVPRA